MDVRGIDDLELKRITQQVMAELQKRLEGVQGRQESRRQIQGRIGPGRRLLLLGMPTAEEKASLENTFQVEYDFFQERWSHKELAGVDSVCSWEILLLMQISPETMAYVAHGIFGNKEAACILKGLLEGKKIFLLQNGLKYRNYRETASKNLYALYLQQEDTLRNLGVEVIGHVAELERSVRGVPSLFAGERSQAVPETGFWAVKRECSQAVPEMGFWPVKKEPYPMEDCRGRQKETDGFLDFRHLGLVREADLFRARTSGAKVIKLGRATKITPLAMDFINNYNFSLVRE